MQISISLAEAFYKVFGYKTDAFDPEFKPVTGDLNNKRKEVGKLGSPFYAKDLLGKEIFLPVQIDVGQDTIPGEGRTYAEKLGVKDDKGVYTGKWYLPYPVITMMEIRPHIIDTEMTERDGMVSEHINLSGYSINIKGLLFHKNNEFPEDDFDTINRLASLKKVLTIHNPVTDLFLLPFGGSKNVSIRGLGFENKGGVKHVRGYNLELRSDVPFNLYEIE